LQNPETEKQFGTTTDRLTDRPTDIMRIKSRSQSTSHANTKRSSSIIRCLLFLYHWRGTVLTLCFLFIIFVILPANTAPTFSVFPEEKPQMEQHDILASKQRFWENVELKDKASFVPLVTTHKKHDNNDDGRDKHQGQGILSTEQRGDETTKNKSDNRISSSISSSSSIEIQPFKLNYYDVCIVGAGLSGAVIAEQFASQLGKTCLILEKRHHIGGNCYDYVDPETGILVNKYGAHLFHTNHYRVWEYIQKFSEWTPYQHRVLGKIGDKYVPIPVNINTVNALFDNVNITSVKEMEEWLKNEQISYGDRDPMNSEEMAKSRVGENLYNLIFQPYTIKQWGKDPRDLGPEVTARIPVRNDWDDRYFPNDIFQALPSYGYTKMFEKMIMNHPLIDVHVGVDYFDIRQDMEERSVCGHTFFSGPIDAYFAQKGLDKLEYRSLDFERKVVKDIGQDKFYLPTSVVNYPSQEYNFTRVVEYKHFLKQKSPHTVLFYERSKDGGEPYYPVPNQRNQNLYKQYQDMAEEEPNVTFVGRLANYKYFNMDQSILNALELFDSHAPRVAVYQMCKVDSGGPEALVQLATAYHSWMPYRTFVIHHNKLSKYHGKDWTERGYKSFGSIEMFQMTDLRKGDVLIAPEIIHCPTDLIQKGVKVFIWQLQVPRGDGRIKSNVAKGCQYLSHNFHSLSVVPDIHVPRSRILIPYIRREKAYFGPMQNALRENIILFNHIHPGQNNVTYTKVHEYCKVESKCQVILLENFSVQEINDLYQRAKIIIGECLLGSERSIIEAVLAGVVFVTGECGNGLDFRDFPIPQEHKFSHHHVSIVDVIRRIMENFNDEQLKLAGFRSLYKRYSHETLVEDTKRFFRSVV